MIIFEVIPSFNPLGGAENFVFHLSKVLKRTNDVIVISLYSEENKFVAEALNKMNIKIIYLDKKRGYDRKASRKFKKIYNQYRPDVVHLHLNSIVTCLPVICKRRSLFVYTFHTFISNETYGNKMKPRNLLIKHLIKHKYIFPVTISDTVDVSFKNYFGNYNTEIIYNGIDIKRFNYYPNIEKKNTFISIGSFRDVKNNMFMIECVEQLINEGYDVQYVALGSGKNFDMCNDYVNKNNLSNRIKLLGAVNNVEDYLKESECMLLASHWEGNPLVINEAIASGVWVIANNVGGVKDLIDETNGYLVEPENKQDFVQKMKDFIKNKEIIYNKIIPSNIVNNRKKVDLDASAEHYLELMKKLLQTEKSKK